MRESTAISMSTDKKELLRARVSELTKVSTIPAVLKKIIDVIEDKKSTVGDLERVIERDQAIAARLIGASNAAFYGFPRKISSISQAVLVLGFEMVKGLAISTAVFNGLGRQGFPWLKEMWCHSFETAIASSLIATRTGMVSKDTAFMAGLLHDIGRPILYQIFGNGYADIACKDAAYLIAAETEAYGADHAEVGAWFADRCMFPHETVEAIRAHHQAQHKHSGALTLSDMLPAIVSLADSLTSESGKTGASSHGPTLLKVSEDELALIKDQITGSREDLRAFFS